MLTDDERDDVFLVAWPLLKQLGDDYVTRIHLRRERPPTRSRDIVDADELGFRDIFDPDLDGTTGQTLTALVRASEARTFSDAGVATAPGTPGPNEPVGATRLFEVSFPSVPPLSSATTAGMIAGFQTPTAIGRLSSISVADGSQGQMTSPPLAMRHITPKNYSAGAGSAAVIGYWGDTSATQYSEIYGRVRIRIYGNTNNDGASSGGGTGTYEAQRTFQKLWYHGHGVSTRDPSPLGIASAPGGSTGPSRFVTSAQMDWFIFQSWNADGTDPGGGSVSHRVSGGLAVGAAFWHTVEWYARINTITGGDVRGDPNGLAKVWINGTLGLSLSNVRWRSTVCPLKFRHIHLDPIWGGTSQTKTQTDAIDMDHLYMSGIL